jgi:hypothetical protein
MSGRALTCWARSSAPGVECWYLSIVVAIDERPSQRDTSAMSKRTAAR